MNNIQKKNIIAIFSTVLEAHQSILEYISIGDENQVQNILADCQECIIGVGEVLEVEEGISAVDMGLLEEYCESLYLFLQDMPLDINKGKKWIEKIDAQIHQQITLIEQKIVPKKEIVFFPYKAAMWDCMESVWCAAKEDDECDVYVVAIPYYASQGKGNQAERKYEGDLYPQEVEIIDYSQYDIKTRMPDIVYIHNPYDGGNFVTSIEPAYYASALKPYTHCLVYIPYYMSKGDLPKDHEQLSAYRFVDYIIAQSALMKIGFMKNVESKKILTLGSPKYECMLELEKNKEKVYEQLPQQWKNKIGNKKVIFYNTSISNILEKGEQVLEKIEYVYNICRKNREVVLLWRPHPLMDSSLRALRPELVQRYHQLMKGIEKSNEVMVDHTPTVNKSIVISDLYIGEEQSSVVTLCESIGRPIFLLDEEINKELTKEESKQRKNYFFVDYILVNHEIYFVAQPYNLLCKLNIETKKTTILASLKEDKQYGSIGYVGIYHKENKIILAPWQESDIIEYDITTQSMIKIPLKNRVSHGNCLQIHPFKDKLFLAPEAYQGIIEYEMNTKQCIYYRFDMQKNLQDNLGVKFGYDSFVKNNKLYLLSNDTNLVVTFDLEHKQYDMHRMGEIKEVGFLCYIKEEDFLWLLPQNSDGGIIQWNLATLEEKHYAIKQEVGENVKQPFVGGKYVDGVLKLIGLNATSIKLNLASGSIEPYIVTSKENQQKEKLDPCYFLTQREDNPKQKFIFSGRKNAIGLLNVEDDSCEWIPCQFEVEDINAYYEQEIASQFMDYKLLSRYEYGRESRSNRIELAEVINWVSKQSSHEGNMRKAEFAKHNLGIGVGKQIHERMMEEVR